MQVMVTNWMIDPGDSEPDLSLKDFSVYDVPRDERGVLAEISSRRRTRDNHRDVRLAARAARSCENLSCSSDCD
jgi:hypothetical protein